jgi:outer membrane protein assembly factor BamB
MPQQAPSPFVFVGIGSCVVALDKKSGELVWSTKLRSSSLVSLLHDGPHVFAVSSGEISCLAAATGAILWHNPLKGYGRGFAILAGAASDGIAAAQATEQANAAASSAATTTMMTATMMH